MQFVRNPDSLDLSQGAVVAIGNFDGLHLGHQAIISKLVNKAKEAGLPSLVITFEPSPKQFFCKSTPWRIMRLQDKLSQLKAMGVDKVLGLKFDQALAQLSATDFLEHILIKHCRMRYLLVGEDFCFGHQRQGHVAYLKEKAKTYGYQLETVSPVMRDKERISSTLIREWLKTANMASITDALGRPFHVSARVCHGDKRGRLLGFPTANIKLPQMWLPKKGVYRVKVTLPNQQTYEGVCNLGTRPTVDGTKLVCETHVFNLEREIYGQRIHIAFIQHIRDERRFDSVEALRLQIEQDVKLVKACPNHEA